MPITDLHKQKKTKNIALLIVICITIALFYAITITKFKNLSSTANNKSEIILEDEHKESGKSDSIKE